MNLTKANIKDLKKVTVKINCSNGTEGSGIIVAIEGNLYVLTAAHIIKNGSEESLSPKEIFVSIIKNSQKYTLLVSEVIFFDSSNDAAVLLIGNSNGMPISGLDKVRILTTNVSGPAVFCGFHKGEELLRTYQLENRGEKIWALLNIQLSVQGKDPVSNFEGTSGGGVFYQDTNKVLYLVAYMSEIVRFDGNNNEFVCLPSSNFIVNGVLNTILDSREYEYIADSGVASDIDCKQLLKTLDRSGYDTNQKGPFISNDRTNEIIAQLRNDDEPTILLTALSGMGKTKLIYEAFKVCERLPNRYYAKYGGNREQLLGEMTTILKQNDDSEGIIIIDDCPMELVSEAINLRNNCNGNFRLIMVNHDYFNEELATQRDYTIIKLQPNEMEEMVNQYISSEIGEDENNKNDISEIKKLSGGYPQMAIELVKAYKNSNTASPQTVAYLMPKLLNLTAGNEKEEKAVWQTLSLCMPFPYREAEHEGFKYMIGNNNVAQLNEMKFEERRSLTAKIVGKYSPTLIDKIGEWLYVRPFPLAVWLTAEWFKNVCNTSAHFTELINDIKKQPELVQNAISIGFCKHIQQMSGNKEAFDMVKLLVNSDICDSFFNEETLSSGLGSKLFLAMSTVNPAAIARCLRNVLGNKDIAWLREHFDGDGRRYVVWALERLCFAKESYNDAVLMMAKLAVAENEGIANNATAQLIQLFHYILAGTEVDLKVRLQTLKDLVNESDEYIPILVRCFDAALQNRSFFRSRGAEKFGFENRKDYVPETWEEVYNYWNGCRDILLEWMDKKPVVVGKVAELVEGNVYHWARGGQKDILVSLLNKIAEKKDYCWNKGYEALAQIVYSYGINGKDLGITDLMEKLNSGTFMTKLNDARYKFQRRNDLSDEEKRELYKTLFSPLVNAFWNEKIYLETKEVETLLENTGYIPIDFVRDLVNYASDEQLKSFFDVIIEVVKLKSEVFNSYFLRSISFYSKDRKPLMSFLDKIRDCGREYIYISLMAGTEDNALMHFKQLVLEKEKEILKLDFLPIYLLYFRSYGNEHYLMMLKTLMENFPDRPNDLISFVLNERFMISKDDCPESVDIVKKALLEFNVEGENGRMLNDYTRILVKTLQYCHDEEFAKQVNSKFIKVYNTKIVHLNMKGIFTALLKDYAKEVLPDFINAFLGEDTFLFYYQVKDELGSGFGFGNGPLFDLDENLIKQICMQHPDSAPTRIASMVPCYDLDTNGKITDKFNKWVIWLLDNFGEQKEVRSNISANIGTFSWTGDLSPYYERNIKCFEQLLNHNKQEVKDWAKECISYQKKLFDKEKKDETYRNICSEL